MCTNFYLLSCKMMKIHMKKYCHLPFFNPISASVFNTARSLIKSLSICSLFKGSEEEKEEMWHFFLRLNIRVILITESDV
jgi:hypothetical protein